MKLRSLLLVVVLGVAGLVTVTPSAQATAYTQLPFGFLTDIQVDDAHGKVFLSGGGSLVTTDLAGHPVSFPDPGDVGRIAATPDGSALLITRTTSGADGRISVLDPATGTITKTVTLPVGCSVGDIAPASGKVFFYSFCTGDDAWKIGAVDLTTNLVTLGLQTPAPGYSGDLYSVPGAPSMLVTRIVNRVIVYDTTGGAIPTATVRASRAVGPYDLALMPDGSQVVVSGGMTLVAYSTTDLAEVGGYYSAGGGPVAIRGDGTVASVGSADLRYFKPGVFEPDQVRQVEGTGTYSPPGSLAFGSKRLYRVSGSVPAYLSVDTPGPPAVLGISPVASTYGYGASPSVTVTISSPTTSRALNLYAMPSYGGSKKLVKTVDVGPSGTLTTTMPKAYLNTKYTAEFEGDADFSASSVTTSVSVKPQITISTASTSKSSYFHKLAAEPSPSMLVKVLPGTPVAGCLTIVYQRYTLSGWVTRSHSDCVTRTNGNSYKTRLSGSRGQKIRIMATLTKSAYNASASSSWYYILFT